MSQQMLSSVRELYDNHQRELAVFDEMVDELSVARAKGTLGLLHDSPLWKLYLKGRKAQADLECKVVKPLAEEGSERARLLAEWMQQVRF